MSCIRSSAKTANTATMMVAAPVTEPAVVRMPSRIASRVAKPRSWASRIRETTKTW